MEVIRIRRVFFNIQFNCLHYWKDNYEVYFYGSL